MHKSLITGLFFTLSVSSILWAQTWNPRPGWKDSYEANGFCWCQSTFDHDLNDKKVLINGVPYSVVDICDELEQHPQYRAFANGDPAYNDIQCGNGPFNNAADESGCPGRVDLGSAGCQTLGVHWDMDWLSSRPRFTGGTVPTPLGIPGKIEAEDFIVDSGIKTESHNDGGGSTGIGSIHSGDHVDFSVEVAAAGRYEIMARVSSNTQGGTITFRDDSTEFGKLTVANTGGWNSWQTAMGQVDLPAGKHILRLAFTGPSGFLINMNWLEFTPLTTQNDPSWAAAVRIFPNPTAGIVYIKAEGVSPHTSLEIYQAQGRVIYRGTLKDQPIDLSPFSKGLYLLKLNDPAGSYHQQVMVK